ncbi:3127_t:CDS:2, partial [Gigaspora margarita]
MSDYVKTTKDIEHLMYTPSTIITIKESAQALEAQLNALYEQIQEKKSNKSQSPLEYIDRSIRNIIKGLFVPPIIKAEPNKLSTKNISYSIDAAEVTAAYLNKERICERLKTINKFNRKSPVKTGVFEENKNNDSYEEIQSFIHDDIYTLPESLGIQETKQTTEVAQSIRFQPTEIESLLSF